MHPTILGFIDSYILFIAIGIILAVGLALFYCIYLKKFKKNDIFDMLICTCGAIVFGFLFALLFENLYEFLDDPKNYQWGWGITFYGGLFGGIVGFLFIYLVFLRKKSTLPMGEVLKIAPACVTLAHGFGRIGCFMAGCCYGKETTSWIGVQFPDLPNKVIPTQLIEAIFLFILTAVLLVLIFTINFNYTSLVYLGGYGLFRFIIEFFRGDYRGGFLGFLSPSQIWSIVFMLSVVPLYFLLKKVVYNEGKKGKEVSC